MQVDYRVLMNKNNPNLKCKYEEAYKIERTPAQRTKTSDDHKLRW